MTPFTAAKEQSSILRLPAGRRTEFLNKISANANAPGGCKNQTNGRASQAALQRLAGTCGIYAIETDWTAANAYSIGGPVPATITIESGTPATTAIATNELDPVTFAAPAGVRSLTVQVSNTLAGNAKIAVPTP